ncbi:unnamed protein product [Strongylus vulgaris]|uniref:Uncharacterized protein n=1 Tax=Strongylus vulgaris TaxID=40348 RepID=A0A3P7JLT0_STRVU|nr:unnamed protein product [Strongylus vulgaris]
MKRWDAALRQQRAPDGAIIRVNGHAECGKRPMAIVPGDRHSAAIEPIKVS